MISTILTCREVPGLHASTETANVGKEYFHEKISGLRAASGENGMKAVIHLSNDNEHESASSWSVDGEGSNSHDSGMQSQSQKNSHENQNRFPNKVC